jgi:hypothetical protein
MSKRVITAVLALLTALFGASGFVLGLAGFGSNILANLAGVTLSVLVAYTLVEALLRRQREQEWTHVHQAIRSAIANRVQSIAFVFFLVDNEPRSWLDARTPHEIAASLDAMATHLLDSRKEPGQRQQDEIATSRELHREVSADIEFIRDVLAARVFTLAGDPALAAVLAALDEAERQWREGIQLI